MAEVAEKMGYDMPVVSGAKRALVIDDDKQISRMVARTLTKNGEFQVSVASEPGIGLLRAKQQQFDVIVSDLMMPGMNGLDLIRGIRTFNLDIPIILLTGTPTIETAQRAIELGAYRYLTKPFDPVELVDIAKQATFAHRISQLKRQAFQISGLEEMRPGDLAGITDAFDSTLQTMCIAYQPIVHASDGRLFGYEALMRSQNKMLPYPNSVLQAAEHLDRIHDLGRVIRNLASEPFARKNNEAKLFLNLHPRDLTDAELMENASLLGMSDRIVLEITERENLDRSSELDDSLSKLRQLGFTIAVDDLGAGYAGLSCFASLQPGIIKLDMSLISDIHLSHVKQRVVESMVETSHDLDILVVAEGVETEQELEACRDAGVDLLQGYFIARPAISSFPEIHWPY